MKIIQVNAWLGHLMYELMKLIEEEKPDIVCAQEVQQAEWGQSVFDTLALHTRLAEHFSESFISPTFDYPMLGQSVQYGNAIYANFPLSNQQTVFTYQQYHSNAKVEDFDSNVRNIQSCTVTTPAGPVHIANHHGYHELNRLGSATTVAAMENVIAHLKTLPEPLIFCGDLNVAPESEAIKLLDNSTKLQNLTAQHHLSTTLSSVFRKPGIAVPADYIFVSKNINVRSFSVSPKVVSDHQALILEFDL